MDLAIYGGGIHLTLVVILGDRARSNHLSDTRSAGDLDHIVVSVSFVHAKG